MYHLVSHSRFRKEDWNFVRGKREMRSKLACVDVETDGTK